jgi:catechol 2,3-dioxygenase-like lactoylglutathione lyase family enzyme
VAPAGLTTASASRYLSTPRSRARHDVAGRTVTSRPIPIFSVRNLKDSERYYRDALGFKVDWEYGEPPDFGSVTRAATTIFLCQGCEEPGGSWVMVFAADVDRLHRELQGKGAIIKHPPTDEPWKLREMQVADPDGNVIRFATSSEH